jgi:hypothetical protein
VTFGAGGRRMSTKRPPGSMVSTPRDAQRPHRELRTERANRGLVRRVHCQRADATRSLPLTASAPATTRWGCGPRARRRCSTASAAIEASRPAQRSRNRTTGPNFLSEAGRGASCPPVRAAPCSRARPRTREQFDERPCNRPRDAVRGAAAGLRRRRPGSPPARSPIRFMER